MQAARTEEMPWLRPSSLSRKVPQSPSKREQFYKIDTFHVGHKGVMGDLCANAIATRHVQAVANTKQVLLHVLKVVVLKTTNRKGQTSAIAFHVLKSSLSTKVALFDLQIDGMAISSGIDTVYDQLVAFAKENSLPLHMLQLSRTILGFANSWSFPAASLDVLSKITFSDAFFGNFWHVFSKLVWAPTQGMVQGCWHHDFDILFGAPLRQDPWRWSRTGACHLHRIDSGMPAGLEQIFQDPLQGFTLAH